VTEGRKNYKSGERRVKENKKRHGEEDFVAGTVTKLLYS
jgi:hypothetical protein